MLLLNQLKNIKALLIILFIILLTGPLIAWSWPVLFQEGSPWPPVKGIMQLNLTTQNLIKLSGQKNKYITKNKNGATIIQEYMRGRGYSFIEQMGSAYFFQSTNGSTIIVSHKQYSRFYSLWTINNINNGSNGNNNSDNSNNNNNLDNNSNLWLTTKTDDDLVFQYPQKLPTTYLSEVDWPPQIMIINQKFTCQPSGNKFQEGGEMVWQLINNRQYCLTMQNQGAAGSTYTTYAYTFPVDQQTGLVIFTLRSVHCDNYDKPQAIECYNEQSSFDLNNLIDKIAQSIKNLNNSPSLADQLKDCLLKSDLTSQEQCSKLLTKVYNFEDCLNAGFTTTNTSPLQCNTPDGRVFTNEATSDWLTALIALNNCQVKTVVQAHNHLVTLDLDNDNQLAVYEPKIDEVFKIVQSLKNKCGQPILITE